MLRIKIIICCAVNLFNRYFVISLFRYFVISLFRYFVISLFCSIYAAILMVFNDLSFAGLQRSYRTHLKVAIGAQR